jgi:hypothetical protein
VVSHLRNNLCNFTHSKVREKHFNFTAAKSAAVTTTTTTTTTSTTTSNTAVETATSRNIMKPERKDLKRNTK